MGPGGAEEGLPSGLLEILRNRFTAIVNEMGFTLLQTGFTVFIKGEDVEVLTASDSHRASKSQPR